jgi:hypothetical protein
MQQGLGGGAVMEEPVSILKADAAQVGIVFFIAFAAGLIMYQPFFGQPQGDVVCDEIRLEKIFVDLDGDDDFHYYKWGKYLYDVCSSALFSGSICVPYDTKEVITPRGPATAPVCLWINCSKFKNQTEVSS